MLMYILKRVVIRLLLSCLMEWSSREEKVRKRRVACVNIRFVLSVCETVNCNSYFVSLHFRSTRMAGIGCK